VAALQEAKMLDARERIALARSVLAQAEAAHGTTVRSLGVPVLPVVDELAPLLPGGGLRCGAVTVLEGSTSLLLTLLSRATQEGAWCAVVGFPALGSLAAFETGVELSRLALIPDPGQQVGQVLATLVDGIDLVVVGPEVTTRHLNPSTQRQISARVKERGAVLISMNPWQGAQQTLQAQVSGWQGLGQGHGYLTKQDLLLGRGGRGAHSPHVGRVSDSGQRQIWAQVSLPLEVASAAF